MLEYNTARNELIIKEYGRNIQKMIEYAGKIKDDKKRTEAAWDIIRVMSQMNPNTSEVPADPEQQIESLDYWNKLWDHLFIISNYQLDVAAPFPKPEPVKAKAPVKKFEYWKGPIPHRTYGRNMEKTLKAVSQYPQSERDKLAKPLANHLKKLYLTYNRETVDDKLILSQLSEFSEGKISLPPGIALESTREILLQNLSNPAKPPVIISNKSKNGKKKKKKKKSL